MKRLSWGLAFFRFGMPVLCIIGAVAFISASPVLGPVIPFMLIGLVGYSIWYGWRLSEVWLDGDALQVKGPRGSFRVPLSDVLLLDTGSSYQMRRGQQVFVLGLDHPVGKVQTIRFIPAHDGIERELQAYIHAARAARRS